MVKLFGKKNAETAKADAATNLEDFEADNVTEVELENKAEETEEETENRLAYESLMRHRKERKRKKLIKAGIAAAIILVIAGYFGISHFLKPKAADTSSDIMTTTISQEDFTNTVSATGTMQPLSSTAVTPEVDGIVQNVAVSQGSVVHKGDTLFTIKNDSLDAAVTKASQDVKSAQNGVNSAKAALTAARQAAASSASAAAASAANTSQDDSDSANSSSSSSDSASSISDAQSSLASAQLSLESAQTAYNEAVATANKRTVTAPIDGTVLVMNAVNGASVGSGSSDSSSSSSSTSSSSSLIEIGDLSQMRVNIQVNEADINKISVGQKASVTYIALPSVTSEAKVTNIASVSSSGSTSDSSYSGSGSVVTYAVSLLVEHPDSQIKPGMSASVDIVLQDLKNVFTVPTTAVQTDNGKSYITIVKRDSQGAIKNEKTVKVTVPAQTTSTAVIEGKAIKEGLEVELMGSGM